MVSFLTDTERRRSAEHDLKQRQTALNHRTSDINDRDIREQRSCYTRFFVNRCLDRVRARIRTERAALRADQLALDQARRTAHAQHRAQEKMQQQVQYKRRASTHAEEVQHNRARFEEKQRVYQRVLKRNALKPHKNAPRRSCAIRQNNAPLKNINLNARIKI